MRMTRRQFLRTTAAGAAAVGTAAYALADGSSYAVQGIDVSQFQGNVNWDLVATAGKTFCYCRATTGMTADTKFSSYWPEVQRIGLLRGAYYHVQPSTTAGAAKAQADFFLATANPSSGDLRPMLDVETTNSLSPAQVWQFLQLVTARIKGKLGRAPIIYTGFFFWQEMVGNPRSNLDCPLWLARYDTEIPAQFFPSNTWNTWTFWQYTSSGVIPGITQNTVDLDAFQGTLADLNKLRLP